MTSMCLCLCSVAACGSGESTAAKGSESLGGSPPSLAGQPAAAAGNSLVSGDGASLAAPKWAYMLQGDVATAVAGTGFDFVVMDYTKDGSDEVGQRYTEAEMALIRGEGRGRVALAYLSIGEAEEYRYYFDPGWVDEAAPGRPDPDAPTWLGMENPEWEGCYQVRYWSEEWQALVLGYVDRVVAYGFDGVYVDVVDGFEYWSDKDNGQGYRLSEAEAAERMIAFVLKLAGHARGLDADFLVVPQNAERLFGFDSASRYLLTIDGIGVEDLFYDERVAIEPVVTAERTLLLDKVSAAGKPVIVVDYVYAGSRDAVVADFLAQATAAGYFPYAADTSRALDRLVVFGGQGE